MREFHVLLISVSDNDIRRSGNLQCGNKVMVEGSRCHLILTSEVWFIRDIKFCHMEALIWCGKAL